jgi:hypothetical protein
MTTSRRPQQRYDHRLRDLVHNTGNVTIATDLGVPRSTARGWLRTAPRVAVTMDVTNVKTSELQPRSSATPATREEAHGTSPARPRPASKLGIHLDARASARRTRQIRILRAVDRARCATSRWLESFAGRFLAWPGAREAGAGASRTCARGDTRSRARPRPCRAAARGRRACRSGRAGTRARSPSCSGAARLP